MQVLRSFWKTRPRQYPNNIRISVQGMCFVYPPFCSDKLNDFVYHVQHLIGWFSYRCNTSHRISLRERSVHRKLLEKLTDIVNIGT